MGEEYDDYGNLLSTSLANADATNALNTQNLANTQGANDATTWLNSVGANTDYGSTTGDGSAGTGVTIPGTNGPITDLAGLSKWISNNKGLIAGGAAIMGATGNNKTQYGKSGYQGSIPELTATRKMISAPPTRAQGYRPGSGGIDYGGDVTYTRTPGVDPWWQLSGGSGSSSGADLTGLLNNIQNTGGISNLVSGSGVNTGNVNTTKTDTKTDTKTNLSGVTAAQQTAIDNWKKGLTPQQYLSQINQWIADHPNLTTKELNDALATFKVSQTDLQTALGANKNLSAADVYALSHGQGLKEANTQQTASIAKWIQDNPYATSQQISDAIKGSGVNTTDIKEALTGTKLSKGYQDALLGGGGLNTYYNTINKYLEDQARDTATPNYLEEFSKAKAKQDFGVSDEDIAAAQKYATTETGKKELEAMYVPQLPKDISGMSESDIFKLYDSQRDAGFTDAQLREAAGKTYGEMSDTDWNYIKTQAGYAGGGEIAMAKGRYLQGETDGMADKLPAQIGNNQPAALSHGEFVIPADVVSHMGNGNSDAGAKKLYQMMDKIRMARTGNKKQGKRINPDKFMPGGLAQAYATGGAVKKFVDGGSTGTPAANFNAGLAGVESNLSNWAGPFTTNMLGQGQALANMPYQAYMGQLSAGASPLQTSAFTNAANLQTPSSIGTAATTAGDIATKAQGLSYTPTTTSFDATQAQNYMNPYLQASLNPQLDEARRQSQISQLGNAKAMTQAGAFGGSRGAIMDAETQRNLGTNLANITGQGYNTAYDKATQQFNADQTRKMQEAQYGAGFGLQGLQAGLQAAQAQGQLGTQENQVGINNLNAQLTAGTTQRGIESEGLAADKTQFEEARANPYKMVQFQQSLLQGLPTASQSYNATQPSTLQSAAQATTTVNQLLKNLGL